MKTHFFLLIFSLVLLLNQEAKSQTIFTNFKENFENGGSLPPGWKNVYASSNLNWRFENGGYSTNPSIPNSRRPPAAFQGGYNALFEKGTLTTTVTKLVTPLINFNGAIKPELHFWYANYTRNVLSPENDKIRVYYRSVDEIPYDWILLHEILDPHSAWTEAVVQIPDTVKFTNVELAFEGEIGPGWGACIDSISIIETGVLPKSLETLTATQSAANNVPTGSLPTGSTNNPVLRLDLTVIGNSGNLYIDTLILTPLLNTLDVIQPSHIKLYYTTNSVFKSDEPISATISLTNNQFLIANINKNFPFGYSYVWITLDIPADSLHEYSGKKVDFKIQKNHVKVNGVWIQPLTELNPNGSRTVNESIFFDGFESTNQWTLTGEFEIDKPLGKGGTYGEPDPDYAFNGLKVMGTDLNGIGTTKGDYENNLADNAYLATSPIFNCKYFKDVKLQYYQWLNIEIGDSAKIQLQKNSTYDWKTSWVNQNLIKDATWTAKSHDIGNTANRNPELKTRFVLGPTNNTWTFSGWNIDDFAVTGIFLKYDASIVAWVSPGAGCGHIAPEQLVVKIKNYGYNAIPANMPIGFSINGGSYTMDVVPVTIAQDGELQFTFNPLIDLTTPGEYNLKVKTFLANDQDTLNDSFDTTLYILPTYSLPYTENFESSNGFWQAGGTNTWKYGTPNATVINAAYSGTKCWVTNLNGNYPDNDSSWIESPCINFSGIEKPIIEAMIKSRAEIGNDGLTLLYSIDEGASWENVPEVESYDWNWYTQNIQALGTPGWDSITDGWFMVRQTLPAEVSGVNPVKFRFVFASNDTIAHEGFAIDNIRIYDAPVDAGVTALTNPVTSCYLSSSETVTVTLKNFGIRAIKPSDNLITYLKRNGQTVLVDTFNVLSNLAIGASANFSFDNKANLRDSGNYDFVAFTKIIGDSALFTNGVSNDTLLQTIRVKGEPDYSLGPDIGTEDPSTVDLDAGSGYISYLWQDASTNQIFNVLTEGEYSVTVTNSENCQAVDTIEVIASTTNLGVTAINGITSGCEPNITSTLQVEVTNYGPKVYVENDTIQVGYQINNGIEVIETITIAASGLGDPGTLLYTFLNQPTFSTPGIKNFKCFSVFTPELNYNNDTAYTSIEVYALPEIDLGTDTIYTALSTPIILDAGAGLKDYLWQDATTNSTFTVDDDKTSKKYYVQASDLNDCATDSDTVWIFTDDWKIDTILFPANECAHSITENITLQLKNNSENIYSAGTIIPVKTILNNTAVTENISLLTSVGVNETYIHTLIRKADLSAIGVYDLTAQLYPYHDRDSLNNTKSKSFETYGIFYVDLGADTIATMQADTILLDASDIFETYSWNSGSTASTYQITSISSGFYKVTTSDIHNCAISSDSVKIMASDVSIDEIKSPKSSCILKDATNITFVLRNSGNDKILAGTSMKVYYSLNNGAWTGKDFNLPFDLNTNTTKQITINENIILDSLTNYDFKLAIRYAQDLFFENDTIGTTLFQFPSPMVDLGADIYTTIADTIVLKSNAVFANYQWQDFSILNQFAVTNKSTSTYNLLVNNAYGCTDADTLLIYTYDLGIESVESPNNCEPSTENTVTINIKLNSEDVLLAGEEITATYDFEGTVVTETVVLTDTFTNDAVLPYTFATPFTVSDTGNYSITCSVAMGNEVDSSNNSLNADFRIGAYPVILGADVVTYASSVLLNAGAGFTGYLWTDSSTDQTLTVTLSGYYAVTTTDLNGCEASDSIHVLFLHPDYQIIEIMGVANNCSNGVAENISFELKNEGNDTIQAATEIPISYTINGGTAVTENYTFVSKFLPENTVTITFGTAANLSTSGAYEILVSATLAGTASTNNTTVNTWGYPSVNLGNNIETPNDEVMLDAGSGFASYLWSTAETTQTITVSTNGDYWVEVTNSNACTNRDTVNVFFVPTSLFVSDFVRPLTACEFLVNESVTIKVKNGGSKTVPAGTLVVLGYQLEGEDRVNENNTLENAMEANITLEYTFTNKLNSSTSGNKEINFYVRIDSEDIDTAEYEISVYEKPQFFGGEDTIFVSSYPYELDAEVEAESYLWNTDATTPTLTVNADGAYWLKIIDDKACEFTDTVFVDKITGISDSWSNQIEVYPNPGESEISVNLPKNIGKVNLQITDLQGKLVFVKKDVSDNLKLDISKWEQGAYILRISNGEQFGVYRIVKQ